MLSVLRVWLRTGAGLAYSTALGALVGGLIWHVCRGWLPRPAVFAVSGILAIRVAALFGSITVAAGLNWKAIWIGWSAGLVAMVALWPSAAALSVLAPPAPLLAPILLASVVTAGTAPTLPSRTTRHFYHTSRFARLLHFLQGLILFFMALPASLFWEWTRPFVVVITISAFALWKLWGACPVTLVENEARAREGLPIMPPDSGFVPDVLARFGLSVSGEAVGVLLYGIGLSLCGWFGVNWLIG